MLSEAVRVAQYTNFNNFLAQLAELKTGCLTMQEMQEIYWNYFSSWISWKCSGNLQNSRCIRVFVVIMTHNSCISKCIGRNIWQ